MIKRILNISLLVVSVLGLFISLAFSTRESDKFPCQKIEIKVDDHITGNFFVTEDDVLDMSIGLQGWFPLSCLPNTVSCLCSADFAVLCAADEDRFLGMFGRDHYPSLVNLSRTLV